VLLGRYFAKLSLMNIFKCFTGYERFFENTKSERGIFLNVLIKKKNVMS